MSQLPNEPPEDPFVGRIPDTEGHFGPYGGKFIAENELV